MTNDTDDSLADNQDADGLNSEVILSAAGVQQSTQGNSNSGPNGKNGMSGMDAAVKALSRLPGIGTRSAQRIAFHLLKATREEASELASAILDLKNRTLQCSVCFHLSDQDPCDICSNMRRNRQKIMVVEQPSDVMTFESTGMYDGLYHVLMGRLAPLDGIGPDELTLHALVDRMKTYRDDSLEIILATHPDLEGDGTAMYLADTLKKQARAQGISLTLTQLARGLTTGMTLDVASKAVLADAMDGRRPVNH